ncbi:putative ABC transport system permease protein [Natronobacillus azotifigens]|uniref:ABC transporter permease n=1 Tax=Natronobacillus azotifigens TaxID=472978 RepID=A0A9J6RCG8_9BACI|nr:ABC transporter permease [Natronobacillus azotifigens]MCZ0703054.1 ABC transporter permease [Natronobacillus azotifigens]
MNFIKRGFLSVSRKKTKSLILLAVIFILGNVISGSISIQQATDNVETSIKERLGAAATVELDYEKIDQMSEEEHMNLEISNLDLELIKQIGELSYVKYYDYSFSTWLGSDTANSYLGEGVEERYEYDGPSYDFQLKGVNYAPVLDFEEGIGNLLEGRAFEDQEVENGSSVAIISKKLAEINDLQIGDNITFTNSVYSYDYTTGEEKLETSRDVILEVIGLFNPTSVSVEEGDRDQGMFDYMNMEYQNTVYVPNEVVISEVTYQFEEYLKYDEEYAAIVEEEGISMTDYYIPIFVLNSPEDSRSFAEEVQPLLPEIYKVSSSGDQYDSIAAPVESMSKLAGYVLLIAVVATVLIIGLVVLLFLRDRKHELGIYLSLGERRARVVGQILLEVMVVALIGITLSLFTGNLLAQGISETLLNAENTQNQYHDMIYYSELDAYQTNVTMDDVMASYEVKLDFSYILIFYIVGLLTILVSTIIPLIYIVRLNPKKIMM